MNERLGLCQSEPCCGVLPVMSSSWPAGHRSVEGARSYQQLMVGWSNGQVPDAINHMLSQHVCLGANLFWCLVGVYCRQQPMGFL
jgi:hypothetical protein